MEGKFFIKYEWVDKEHFLIIEDNGRVAYAYLLKNEKIIGDVWLYNRCVSPKKNWMEEGRINAFC